ncbi:hypothetical protein FACS1894187_20680 [Synergistales bacterium]|nr:hypothetical protein FACS1894187_20680 [Synergistales bacterium]
MLRKTVCAFLLVVAVFFCVSDVSAATSPTGAAVNKEDAEKAQKRTQEQQRIINSPHDDFASKDELFKTFGDKYIGEDKKHQDQVNIIILAYRAYKNRNPSVGEIVTVQAP